MPNLKKPLAAYETQTLEFVNAFVNWYYTTYNDKPYSESLAGTLERFVSRNPFDCFELAEMYLDLYTIRQAIKYDATAQEITTWNFEDMESRMDPGHGINLKSWLLLKRQKNVTQK